MAAALAAAPVSAAAVAAAEAGKAETDALSLLDMRTAAEKESINPGRDAGGTLQTLVDNHRRFLAFLEKRVGSKEVAEDILQDGFARALEHAGEVRQGQSIIAWFYRLLRNAVTDHYRHRGAESRAMERAAGMEETSIEIDDHELHETVCGCVMGLMHTLKPEYAVALREVELEEKGLADYASAAGITAGNAAVRVHRAREALRKQVIRCCGTCAVHGCEDCVCGRRGLLR